MSKRKKLDYISKKDYESLPQQYKDKRKSKDHRKKGPR